MTTAPRTPLVHPSSDWHAHYRAALAAVRAAEDARRCGQIETIRVKLLAVGEHLAAMAETQP